MHALLARLEDRVDPMVAIGVAVVAVSTSAILVRLSDAPSLVKACYRVLFMTLTVAPLLPRYLPELRDIEPRDLLFATLAGIGLAAHFAAWFESLEWTTVAASVTLVQTQPAFVAVGAWLLLDERLTSRMVGGILVAMAGVVAMTLGDPLIAALLGDAPVLDTLARTFVGSGHLYGDVLAVIGAIMAAAYMLAGRSIRQRLSLVPYVFVVYGVCTITLFGVTASQGIPLLGYPTNEWLLFAGMALGPGLFGHTIINWALKHVESSVVSVSLLGEPVGSAVLALALFTEVPGPATIAGGAVVLLGIFVTSRARTM